MKTKSIYEKLAIFLAILGFGAEMGSGCANKVAFGPLPQGTANAVSSAPGSGGGGSGGSGGGTAGGGGGCQLENLERPVKIMFVVDTSGSNNSPSMDEGTEACTTLTGCSPATDPKKTFRGGSITTFFNTYQSKTNFSWGFEVFSGTMGQPYITTNGLASFGNSAAMQSAITAFNNETDGDATPYLAALSNVQTAIAGDPDLNSGSPTPLYFVIFLSDGYPTDALSGTNPVTVDLSALDSAVSRIVALAPGRVTLSSVYYGTINDPNAAATLQSMATTGQGQFINVDTGSTSSIVINDLITVPVGQCQ